MNHWWRNLHNEVLISLHSSPSIVRVIKFKSYEVMDDERKVVVQQTNINMGW